MDAVPELSIRVVVTRMRFGLRYLYITERSPMTLPMEAGGLLRMGVLTEVTSSISGGEKEKVFLTIEDYMITS